MSIRHTSWRWLSHVISFIPALGNGQKLVSSPLVTTEYVVWETVNGLSKASDRPRAYALLNSLNDSQHYLLIPTSQELTVRGIQLHRQHTDKDWSLTDCISFLVMRERGIRQALAHDHHFEQAGFEALLRRDLP